MSRPSTLDLPEPRRVTEDPFWAMQVAGALPFALLLLGGLDAVRYAVAGPSLLERSIEVDVLYAAGFAELAAWVSSAILAILSCLSKPHATTKAKRWAWRTLIVLLPVLLASVHWHRGAVFELPR
jgi:hypothetical protein